MLATACAPHGAPCVEAACGQATSAASATDAESAPAPLPIAAAPRCQPVSSDIDPDVVALRLEAFDRIDRGDLLGALQSLRKAREKRPGNHAITTMVAAVEAGITDAQGAAARALGGVSSHHVAAPSTDEHLAAGQATPVSFSIASQTKNRVVDDAQWFAKHGFALPQKRGKSPDLSALTPPTLSGRPLSKVIEHPDHRILIYADQIAVVVLTDGTVLKPFDLSRFTSAGGRGQQFRWAQARGDLLYVLHANYHYARVSKGKNAYLSAVDLNTGQVRWRSRPLVANSQNFVIRGPHLISGYGFTAEDDFIFALDRLTGAIAGQLKLSTAPNYIFAKNGQVFARGYDSDFVFNLSQPATEQTELTEQLRVEPGSRTRVVLAASSMRFPQPTDDDRCWRASALASLDGGRLVDALSQLRHLSGAYLRVPAVATLHDTVEALAQRRVLDLQRVPIRPQRPPFAYTFRRHPEIDIDSIPILTQKSSQRNRITDGRRWLDKHRDNHPAAKLRSAPPDIPKTFAGLRLGVLLDHGSHTIAIYGGRFVVVIEQGVASAIVDYQEFLAPERLSAPEHGQFQQQEITWAERRDGVLYTCQGGGSYAREVFGKKSYLTAIDPTDGALLWRSAPLVCNANFVMLGSHIVSGYGFTDEPDFLFVIDRTTGKTVTRRKLASGPSHLIVDGKHLFVRTYDHDYDFELGP